MNSKSYIKEHQLNQPADLLPLSPQFNEQAHANYVVRLLRAVYEQRVCFNIALAGPYGCGKSSILSEFCSISKKAGHRIVRVGLSTLNPSEIPQKDVIGFLEREILGQILYQGNFNKAPKSSIQGIHRDSHLRSVASAFLLAVFAMLFAAVLVFISDGNTDKLATWVQFWSSSLTGEQLLPTMLKIVFCILVFTALLVASSKLFPSRLTINSFSNGPASLSVEKEQPSFFNKYRDELIYFFEVNGIDAVLFEDLDRFERPLIYEELRNLNTIINCAPGIKKPVKFVYAVRDSLFDDEPFTSDQLNDDRCYSDRNTVRGSSRTKLFDLIISVTPFIAAYSSYEYLHELFSDYIAELKKSSLIEGTDFEDLLRLSSSYLSDMRLLKSIRNDYMIMSEELGFDKSVTHNNKLSLREGSLFAIVIYKNLYPTEFELLRMGKGKLYELLSFFETTVSESMKQLAVLRDVSVTFANSGIFDSAVAAKLGAELDTSIRSYAKPGYTIFINENRYDCEHNSRAIESEEFWTNYFNLSSKDVIGLAPPRSGSAFIRLKKGEFASIFSKGAYETSNRLSTVILSRGLNCNAIEQLISWYRGADFYSLLKDPQTNPYFNDAFNKLALSLFGNELVYEMLIHGYIRKDFFLYIARYPDDARVAAVEFFNKCYRYNLPDPSFELSYEDCEELCKLIPAAHLSEPRCFNTDLLLYMLNTEWRHDDALKIIKSASQYEGSNGDYLLNSIFKFSQDRWRNTPFIKMLVSSTPKAFDYIVDNRDSIETYFTDQEDGPSGSKSADRFNSDITTLIQEALYSIDGDIEYSTANCSDWLKQNGEQALRSLKYLGEEKANAIADLYLSAKVEVISLEKLNASFCLIFKNKGVYSINRNNLLEVSFSSFLPPLNTLRGETILNRVLRDAQSFSEYLNLLTSDEVSCTELEGGLIRDLLAIALRNSHPYSFNMCDLFDQFIRHSKIPQHSVDMYGALDGLPSLYSPKYASSLFRSLTDRKLIQPTLANYHFLKELAEQEPKTNYQSIFIAMFDEPGSIELGDNFLATDEDALSFLNDIIKTPVLNIDYFEAVRHLVPSAFPLTINSISFRFPDHNDLVVQLYLSGLIEPGETVYEHIKGEKLNVRLKVLKQMNEDSNSWETVPNLRPDDIHRLLVRDGYKDGYLWRAVKNNWPYLLKSSCKNADQYNKWEQKILKDL